MVYVEDTGTMLDAPIDVVWAYMASEEHGRAHGPGLRNMTVTQLTPSTVRFEAERNPHGEWERFVGLSTDLAPVGILNEELESSTAGTKMAFLYSPQGGKTQVDIFADALSKTLSEAASVREMLEIAEGAYSDDVLPLREYAKQRASAPPASVRISDLGGRFDVPVEVIWEYLRNTAAHDRSHTGTRHERYEPLPGGAFVISRERHRDGRWTPEALRVTPLRPVALGTEWLEGPLAGSKMITVYRPRSGHTQIDVHGEFVSPTLARNELEPVVREDWAREYSEDAQALTARSRA